MKKYLLHFVGLFLAVGLGLGIAQNINRSVQLSQDPSGPIGFDSSNSVYFPNHINTSQQSTPVIQATPGCGTTPTNVGTDSAGVITSGANTGYCDVTFRTAFTNSPSCVGSRSDATSTTAGFTIVATATGFRLTWATAGGSVFNYQCVGLRG